MWGVKDGFMWLRESPVHDKLQNVLVCLPVSRAKIKTRVLAAGELRNFAIQSSYKTYNSPELCAMNQALPAVCGFGESSILTRVVTDLDGVRSQWAEPFGGEKSTTFTMLHRTKY